MENVCNEAILWCLPLVSYQVCCMQKLPGSRHHGQGLHTVKVAEFPSPRLSLEPLAHPLKPILPALADKPRTQAQDGT